MGYTKPYTYVDGSVLSADNQSLNEEALKLYVNQGITNTDVDTDTIVGESIATPRLVSSVQSADFISKTIQGVSTLLLPQEYSWFTATTKSDNQTSSTVEDWQTLTNTGTEVVITKAGTKVMITFYAKAFAYENSTVARSPMNGLWDNKFVLQYELNGQITRFDGTRAYVWEDFDGSVSPPTPYPVAQGESASRRSIMITRMLTLTQGRYKFSVAVNPKVERGGITTQTFTIETFQV